MFAQAAKDAGLTVNGTVAELEALMQAGKAVSSKILPKVAIIMSKAADKNNGLSDSLQNFDKVVSRAGTSLSMFQRTLFNEGVEDGLKFLLNGFNDLMKSSSYLAKFLGGAFKGAVVGLTAPFRLLYAGIYDVANLIGSDWSKTAKDMSEDIVNITGKVIGLIVGLWALKKGFSMLRGVGGLIGGGKDKAGKSGSSSGSGGKGIAGLLGVQKVFVVNMGAGGMGGMGGTAGKVGKTAQLAAGAAKLGTIAAISYGAGKLIDEALRASIGESYIQADQKFTKTLLDFSDKFKEMSTVGGVSVGVLPSVAYQLAKMPFTREVGATHASPRPQKIEVVVTAKEDWVDAKINDSQNWMGDGIYN